MRIYFVCLSISFLICSCDALFQERSKLAENGPKNDSLAIRPFAIPRTEVHRIQSSFISREYELFIQMPPSYSMKKNDLFPVLVLLDANYAFPLVTSISSRLWSQGNLEEYIVVGVSYSLGDEPGYSKTRDFTPTFSPQERHGFSKEAKMVSGHAEKFAQFLETDVFNFLSKNYRVATNRSVLAGHSFGGLFTCYMAVEHPDAFQCYLAGSPSLWYHNRSIFQIENTFSRSNTQWNVDLLLSVGEMENKFEENKMISNVNDFALQIKMRNYEGLNLRELYIPNEDHHSVYPMFITRGIQWAFSKQEL